MDTNILVYAHRREPTEHAAARRLLAALATGSEAWVLPWPCIYEFLRVVTHPKVFHPPSPVREAWEAIELLLDSPSVVVVYETERHRGVLRQLMKECTVTGNLFHDAHIAALLIEHGVGELVTNDEDFRRFPNLKVTNPFRP